MHWPKAALRFMRSRAIALCAIAALTTGTAAATSESKEDPRWLKAIDARLQSVDEATTMVEEKRAAARVALQARLRALYKRVRATRARVWTDAGARADLLRLRAAARRLLGSDQAELRILDEEVTTLRAARHRLERERQEGATVAMPAARSLRRPVTGPVLSGFGTFRGRRSRADFNQRGIEFGCPARAPVVAPHSGSIEFVGHLRGLGEAVVIRRTDGLRSVLGRVSGVGVSVGDVVEAGRVVATAAANRLYLEVRVPVGAGGYPVDPGPLLGR